jgi:hypothetical protein
VVQHAARISEIRQYEIVLIVKNKRKRKIGIHRNRWNVCVFSIKMQRSFAVYYCNRVSTELQLKIYIIIYIISYNIISHIISYRITSRHVMPCHISYHNIYHIIYHIIQFLIIYHIISYHIIYHIPFHTIYQMVPTFRKMLLLPFTF